MIACLPDNTDYIISRKRFPVWCLKQLSVNPDQTVKSFFSDEMTTGADCIASCVGRPEGRYQSCHGCDVYVICKEGGFMRDNIPCENDNGQNTYFDPMMRTCTINGSPLCSLTSTEPSQPGQSGLVC